MNAGPMSSMPPPPESQAPALFRRGWLLSASESCAGEALIERSAQRAHELSELACEDAIAAGLLAKLWLASVSTRLSREGEMSHHAWAPIKAQLSALVTHVEESTEHIAAADRFVSLCFELDALVLQMERASHAASDGAQIESAMKTVRFASRAFWLVTAAGVLLVLKLPAMRPESALALLGGLCLVVMALFLINARALRTVTLYTSAGGGELSEPVSLLNDFEQDELRGGFLRDLLQEHPALRE